MAASYELFIKHTKALDSSDRRKLMKKLKSVLDTHNPLTVLITNMVGHSYQCLMAWHWQTQGLKACMYRLFIKYT